MQENITWRRDWLSMYESPLSIYDKICYANVITQSEFYKYFGCPLSKNISFLLVRDLDHKKIENIISYPLLSYFQDAISNLSENFLSYKDQTDDFFCKDLYYCNTCSLHGYHSLFFQFKFIKNCPFHKDTLKNKCRKCSLPLTYTFYKSNSISQCCRNCNEPILIHRDSFPNYRAYTENEFKSQDILDLLYMDEERKQILKEIIFVGIKQSSSKQDLSSILHIINEKLRVRQNNSKHRSLLNSDNLFDL